MMLTKRLVLKFVNGNKKWRISYSVMRNLYIRDKQLSSCVTQWQSCYRCFSTQSLHLSSINQHEFKKTDQKWLHQCLCVQLLNTSLYRHSSSDSTVIHEPGKADNVEVSETAEETHGTDEGEEKNVKPDIELAIEDKICQNSEIGDTENEHAFETSSSESENDNDRALATLGEENKPVESERHESKEIISIVDRLIQENTENSCTDSPCTDVSTTVSSTSVSTETLEQKVAIPPLYSVSPIVNESEVLQKLVQLGVDMSVWMEKGMAEKVILMDWERQVQPYVMLLLNAGVKDDQLGTVLTKNPYILEHDVEDIQVRINYLLSKRFTKDQIGLMLYREAIFICMDTKRIDAKLGFYQKHFRLTGTELRTVAGRYAKLITNNSKDFLEDNYCSANAIVMKFHPLLEYERGSIILKKNRQYMKVFLGFTSPELRQIFLVSPRVFFDHKQKISNLFVYLHNEMGLSHQQIADEGWILRKSLQVLKTRHQFLQHLGRAQYDSTSENYISLDALMNKDKVYFCVEVAKASVKEFSDFQKMI